MMMKTVALFLNARTNAPLQLVQVMVRYTNSPTTSAMTAVSAPASTTLATPPTTAPTSTTGMRSANDALTLASPTRRRLNGSSLRSKLFFTAMKWLIAISSAPTRMPGMIPPANSAPTEISLAFASTIIMMLGGMMPPMVELTAVMPAENADG